MGGPSRCITQVCDRLATLFFVIFFPFFYSPCFSTLHSSFLSFSFFYYFLFFLLLLLFYLYSLNEFITAAINVSIGPQTVTEHHLNSIPFNSIKSYQLTWNLRRWLHIFGTPPRGLNLRSWPGRCSAGRGFRGFIKTFPNILFHPKHTHMHTEKNKRKTAGDTARKISWNKSISVILSRKKVMNQLGIEPQYLGVRNSGAKQQPHPLISSLISRYSQFLNIKKKYVI